MAADLVGEEPSYEATLDTYTKICTKELAIEKCQALLDTFPNEEDKDPRCRGPNPKVVKFTGRLGPGGMHAFMYALLADGPGVKDSCAIYSPLEELHIFEGYVQDAGVGHIAQLLVPSKAKNMALQRIVLSGDNITKVGIDQLTMALMSNQSLVELRLDHCEGLEDRAVKSLCNGILLKGNLEILSLKYCSFGSTGAAHLARLLKAGPGESALKSLLIEGNGILPGGLVALAEGVAKTLTLKELNLRGCEIGDPYDPSKFEAIRGMVREAFESFIQAIAANKEICAKVNASGSYDEISPLEHVDLQDNILNKEVAEMLARMITAVDGCAVTTLKVDISTPLYDAVFENMFEGSGGGGKKGKAGKKGKKKKK